MTDTTPLVIEILQDALDVPVTTDMPKNRPDRLVLVDLTGDQSTEFLLMPRYGLTCWGTSDKDAHTTAINAVQALWDAALEHPKLTGCDLETMSRDEWTANGSSRYLAEVALTINI